MQFRKEIKMKLSPGDILCSQYMKNFLIVIIKENLVNCSGNVVDVDGLLKTTKTKKDFLYLTE